MATLVETEYQSFAQFVDELEKSQDGPYISFPLEEANKLLVVLVDLDQNKVITRIDNIPFVNPFPGTTTNLYHQAFLIMQELATRYHRPLLYKFETNHPWMLKWAMDPSKGMGIFDWDQIVENGDTVEFTKLIKPHPGISK